MPTQNRPSGRLSVHGNKRNWSSKGLCDVGCKKKKERKKFDFLLVHHIFKRIQIAAISINFYYSNVFVCFFCVFGSVGGSKHIVRCQRNVSTEQRACHCVSTPIWSSSNPVYLGYTHFSCVCLSCNSHGFCPQRCLWEISHTADHYTKYRSHECTHAHTHKNHYSLVRRTFWSNRILRIIQLKIQSLWKVRSQLKSPILYPFSSLCFSSKTSVEQLCMIYY